MVALFLFLLSIVLGMTLFTFQYIVEQRLFAQMILLILVLPCTMFLGVGLGIGLFCGKYTGLFADNVWEWGKTVY
jgi:hypothetical protein